VQRENSTNSTKSTRNSTVTSCQSRVPTQIRPHKGLKCLHVSDSRRS